MDFSSIDTIFLICIFLIPGYITAGIVRDICPIQKLEDQSALLQYVCFSIINLGIWSWSYKIIFTSDFSNKVWLFWLLLATTSLLGSALVGFIFALLAKYQIVKKLFQLLGISILHTIPNSWDYKFSSIEDYRWVIVKLKNGATIAGLYSNQSFASSDCNERDLYLEKLFLIGKNNKWKEQGNSDGVLIAKDEISTIEFFK